MNTTPATLTLEEQVTLSLMDQGDKLPTTYIPQVPLTEADKIVVALNAMNRSLDKRMDRLTSALLSLVRVLEHR